MAGGPSPGSFKEPVPGSLSYRSWGTALEGQEASCGGGRTSCCPQEPARKAWEWGMSLGEGELVAPKPAKVLLCWEHKTSHNTD